MIDWQRGNSRRTLKLSRIWIDKHLVSSNLADCLSTLIDVCWYLKWLRLKRFNRSQQPFFFREIRRRIFVDDNQRFDHDFLFLDRFLYKRKIGFSLRTRIIITCRSFRPGLWLARPALNDTNYSTCYVYYGKNETAAAQIFLQSATLRALLL